MGKQEGVGVGGGELKVGSTVHWSRKAAIVKYRKGHSVLVRQRRLLEAISRQMYPCYCTPVAPYTPQWTVMGLQGHEHDASKSRHCHLALSIMFLDSTGVWLSCLATNWISVLAPLCLVFTNPVTNNKCSIPW